MKTTPMLKTYRVTYITKQHNTIIDHYTFAEGYNVAEARTNFYETYSRLHPSGKPHPFHVNVKLYSTQKENTK